MEKTVDRMAYELQVTRAIVAKYGKDYGLVQVAEECGELGQAAMKLMRSERGWTPVTQEEAMANLIEEMADMKVMLMYLEYGHLTPEQNMIVQHIADAKFDRMKSRMLDGDMR